MIARQKFVGQNVRGDLRGPRAPPCDCSVPATCADSRRGGQIVLHRPRFALKRVPHFSRLSREVGILLLVVPPAHVGTAAPGCPTTPCRGAPFFRVLCERAGFPQWGFSSLTIPDCHSEERSDEESAHLT